MQIQLKSGRAERIEVRKKKVKYFYIQQKAFEKKNTRKFEVINYVSFWFLS